MKKRKAKSAPKWRWNGTKVELLSEPSPFRTRPDADDTPVSKDKPKS
jgi:hypothetical protein